MEYFGYVCFGLCLLILLALCCCYSNIKLGIAVFKASIAFTKQNCPIFLQPIITMVFLLAWYALMMVSFLWVFSIGTPTPREGYPFLTEIMWDENVRYILIYQVFCFLWFNAFMIGCCQFVIACSAGVWFFNSKADAKSGGSAGNIIKSITWLLKYHVGSIAFGALIIAICQMIRLAFAYIKY
jgi:hypothetical protein